MSWKALVAAQVNLAFDILGDLIDDYVYRDKSNPVLVDGEYTYDDSESTVDGALTKYDTKRIDGKNILIGDKELIVKVSDLASISDDAEFDDPDGVTWTVIDNDQDPSGTIWIIQLRKSKA